MKSLDQPPPEAALQAWVDGRLGAADAARVDAWLAENPEAAARLNSYRAQNAALQAAVRARFPDEVPPRFVVDALAAARPRRPVPLSLARAAALVGAIGLGALAGGGAVMLSVDASGPRIAARDPDAALADDAYLAHATYTSEIRHYVEVTASEPHLLPWLSNRLGQPVSAPDLSASGFNLIGGRLLPTPTGPAAQLMYDDSNGARLTLYLKVEPQAVASGLHFEVRDGANGVWWSEAGFGYALFAPLDREGLLGAAQSVRDQERT